MSYAPDDLLAVRTDLRAATGLSVNEVGIVGDPAHDGGYHCGKDRTSPDDYSRDESPRDARPTNGASAIDNGNAWPKGGTAAAYRFNAALVAGCRANDHRLRDVREVIYTVDGRTVKRFDRLGIRSTGDSSHLYHTHVSFFRDSEGRRHLDDNFGGWCRAYFRGENMAVDGFGYPDAGMPIAEAYRILALIEGTDKVRGGPYAGESVWLVVAVKRVEQKLDALTAKVDAIATAMEAAGGAPSLLPVLAAVESLRKALCDSATDTAANLATDPGQE